MTLYNSPWIRYNKLINTKSWYLTVLVMINIFKFYVIFATKNAHFLYMYVGYLGTRSRPVGIGWRKAKTNIIVRVPPDKVITTSAFYTIWGDLSLRLSSYLWILQGKGMRCNLLRQQMYVSTFKQTRRRICAPVKVLIVSVRHGLSPGQHRANL